ncbi:hypothetical protein CBS101457_006818 [Exobasidium rhododendri]|nr:hypothetical protein CBS101457_006818 [Exobasidium rhododendri]
MFRSLASLTLLAAASMQLVAGQATNQDTIASGIANVVLNLQGAHVVPDLIAASSLKLSALVMQSFGSTSNTPGQTLSIAQVANKPSWSLQYSSNEASAIQNSTFTIMTLDPGTATATVGNVVRHYLANNVSLTNGQLINTTASIAGWFSPAPPVGSGAHRYTTLVFEQPSNFNIPDSLAHTNTTIDTDFDLATYISQTNLGSVVAATFFLCSNTSAGTTSVVPVSTTVVGSSAISSASSSASASLAAAYGTATTTPASGASSSTSGAMQSYQYGYVAVFLACIFAGGAILL